MRLFGFAFRHMVRHWRINVVVWLGLLLTAVFLSGLPMYATSLSGRSLRLQLDNAPVAGRNILVQGQGLTAGLYGQLQESLGDLVRERVEYVEGSPISGFSAFFDTRTEESRTFVELMRLMPYSFSNLNQSVQLVEGRMPQHIDTQPSQFYTVMEVALAVGTAEGVKISEDRYSPALPTAIRVGEELRSESEGIRFRVVGIVQANDVEDEVWWGDLRPLSAGRIDGGLINPDTLVVAMLLPPRSMDEYIEGKSRSWRILTDVSKIDVSNETAVLAGLKQLESQTQRSGIRIESQLIPILEKYQADLATSRATLFLLSMQSLLFVLYTLAMVSSFVLDQSRRELASLAGRGFTSWQITQIFGLQTAVLGLLALPLAPFVAQALLRIWGALTDTAVVDFIPNESWLLTAVAVVFGWLTITISIWLASRRSILAWQQQLARPSRFAGWQRSYFDLFLLVLGGLIYWQLRDAGSFVARSNDALVQGLAGTADPLLLIGPSLLLIGVALVFLRLFPLLLRGISWATRQVQGLILPFGLAKLSRDPVGPSRVILLVSLAAGLMLFTTTFKHSLAQRQQEMAHYESGADLRVQLPKDDPAAQYDSLAAIDGVQAWSPVYVNRSRWAAQLSREANLVAVDPQTFTAVANYAPGITTLRLADIMGALEPFDSDAIPAVFSADAYPQGKQVGDRITYIVGQYKVEFEVRGIIVNLPAVESPFFITNLAQVEAAVDLGTLTQPWDGSREIWLTVDPAKHDAVVRELNGRVPSGAVLGIVADTQQRVADLQSNMVALQALGAFDLNAVTLIALSVLIFLLVHFFAARQRLYEFSLLRSMGLSARQLMGLLSLEGVLMIVLGLVAGTALGYGLALIMRPFLSRTLSVALGGDTIRQIIVNVPQTVSLYGLLIGFYALALLALLVFLLRSGIHRVLRIGEE